MTRIPFPRLSRPLVAILRGIRPEESEAIVSGLIEAGLRAIEIPLNSPEPFRSIETAARLAPDECLIGAGTVLSVEDVDRLARAGGRLLVSPNTDARVIARAARHEMVTMPGVMTPTEAFAAIAAGASALKVFPAGVLGPKGIAAMMAVLPGDIAVAAVGGVTEADFAAYAGVGIRSFGLGSSLYRPGMTAGETRARAAATIAAYDAVFGETT